jgi:prepilin-type N-terminal cleavage/methylation domain-containing protein/prepilin-type processing-associated H-X9-DG protein
MIDPTHNPVFVRTQSRQAFTLIELLVVILILAILTGLLLAAVQSSRNAARIAQCKSNLKQINTALHGYVASHGNFPGFAFHMGFSVHCTILPYLEQTALYDSMNFEVEHTGPGPVAANTTSWRMSPEVFLCPADMVGRTPTGANYAGNRGHGYTEAFGKNNGLFTLTRTSGTITFASIPDGASNTSAYSEFLITNHMDANRNPERTVFQSVDWLLEEEQFDQFVSDCIGLRPRSAQIAAMTKGRDWMRGDLFRTLYNHNLLPNGHSCLNKTAVQQGAATATSAHWGGVNVAFVDGHVQFVRDSIALEVWRALGTRNGGETITAESIY